MAIVSRPTLQSPVSPGFCLNTEWLTNLLDSYFNKVSDDIRIPNWNIANSYVLNDKVIDPATGRVYIALNSVPPGTPLEVNGPNWRTYDPAITPPNPATIINVANINNPVELATLGVADGPIVVAEAGSDGAIWYNYVLDPNLVASAPYVMASADTNGYWVAFPQSSNAFNFALGASVRTQAVVNILSPTELNSIPGTFATALLVYQTNAAFLGYTLYVYSGEPFLGPPTQVAPYTYAANGGGFWVAIAGLVAQNGVISNGNYDIRNINGADATFTNLLVYTLGRFDGILQVGTPVSPPPVYSASFEGLVYTEGGISDVGGISSSKNITGINISRQGTTSQGQIIFNLNATITLNPDGNIFLNGSTSMSASTVIILPHSSNYAIGTQLRIIFSFDVTANNNAQFSIPTGDSARFFKNLLSQTDTTVAVSEIPGANVGNLLAQEIYFTLVTTNGSNRRWVPKAIR